MATLKELEAELLYKEACFENHLPREIIYGIYENEIAELKKKIKEIKK